MQWRWKRCLQWKSETQSDSDGCGICEIVSSSTSILSTIWASSRQMGHVSPCVGVHLTSIPSGICGDWALAASTSGALITKSPNASMKPPRELLCTTMTDNSGMPGNCSTYTAISLRLCMSATRSSSRMNLNGSMGDGGCSGSATGCYIYTGNVNRFFF